MYSVFSFVFAVLNLLAYGFSRNEMFTYVGFACLAEMLASSLMDSYSFPKAVEIALCTAMVALYAAFAVASVPMIIKFSGVMMDYYFIAAESVLLMLTAIIYTPYQTEEQITE